MKKLRRDAARIFHAGLKAVEPGKAVKRHMKRQGNHLLIGDLSYDLSGIHNVYVIGAGKASAAMAQAVEAVLGSGIKDGIVNVKYGHVAPLKKIRLVEAGHPVPDDSGRRGAEAILKLASEAGKDDLVICLISGGGSALIPLPAEGLSLQDKQATTQLLLECGATIHEINTIRKHISGIKGGRLARAAHPARLVSFILSDVVGDDLDVIASGPTVPDTSTFADCMAIFKAYDLQSKLPKAILSHIHAGTAGHRPETPKSDDPAFETTRTLTVGTNFDAMEAARKAARDLGYNTILLSSMIEGETRDVAKVHSAIAREVLKTGHPVAPPACILSGGETTVTIRGTGKGGRNQEFALAAALEIVGLDNLVIFSAGTDGTDGPTDAAGAVVDFDTVPRAMALGLNPRDFLFNNDAYHFFQPLEDLIITGPTNTNVMDVRIMLMGGKEVEDAED